MNEDVLINHSIVPDFALISHKMSMGTYIIVILVAAVLADAKENVFQPPEDSDISEIKGTSTPWVKAEFRDTINEFAKNTSEELQSLELVKKIYDLKIESREIRSIFFKQVNKFLSGIGHPAPSALANVVSMAGALFDYLPMSVFFEAVDDMTAEFFLARGLPVDRSLSQKYANAVQTALESSGTDGNEAVLQGALDGYSIFAEPYGYNSLDVQDEQFELFASALIILHDK